MIKEKWLPVVGFNGYFVSDKGNVKSSDRLINMGVNKRLSRGQALKAQVAKRGGYLTVGLSFNGYNKNAKIHRLVAIAFIPNPLNKPQVNHKDGDKNNNNVSNLEWATSSENIRHAHATGLIKVNKIATGRPVISTNIKTGESKSFPSIREAGRSLNIFGQNICAVLKGKIKAANGYKFTVNHLPGG